jgi:uncharacterized protein (TIGR02145 family)
MIHNDGSYQVALMKSRNLRLIAIVVLLAGLTGCYKDSIKDIDGNYYKTVTIGSQVWMKENLKTTRCNDGTTIPLMSNYDSWAALSTPAYCWFANDSANKDVYGALYNYYVVDTKKICPEGWHVPADSEWVRLMRSFDHPDSVGNKLKEAGKSHWKSPNSEATNESGFTALPGGFRSYNGSFNYLWISGYWWSSSEYTDTTVYFWNLRYKSSNVFKYVSNKTNGFSVRCLKDK